MARRLFGEIHPITYRISVAKGRFLRNVSDLRPSLHLAKTRDQADLPVVVYRHNSLIRRRLGNVNPELQDNKAVSLSIAAPKVDGVLIRPGEVFSFWKLVGPVSARRGYREGLTIDHDQAASGIGGGMCQFTNLIHWMVLHTPLEIVEHHHHSGLDLFPDFNRQIPFGTGTSIVYNYLDYRFRNPTSQAFQLRVSVGDDYLSGELRTESALPLKYHIHEQDSCFFRHDGSVYRHNSIHRTARDKRTGLEVMRQHLSTNTALVCYPEDLVRLPILDERPTRAVVEAR
ncbi:VanW family protein [Sinomonas sp. ASV486]|uniref:VanW family protein n=1 Tax=Sinomonas sp. ASV486 TaxID=3051170 RepID=UPI0027DB9BE8|nr:VanW family protein [Sinomonas sp. ASV486]MDQ4489483.1 VanW family protein [Sinomonas sp. ASV486]